MSDDFQKQVEQTLAFARYLSWADLLNNLFEAEMTKEVEAADATALQEHEWRWFGLMCYWYASVHVVIEAWNKLGFSDPVIDRLLAHPEELRALLRRHRNAVFHYQKSLDDPRFVDLLALGTLHVHWVWALHDEFMRFFAEYLSGQVVTHAQRVELRQEVEACIHWYPYRQTRQLESLERTLGHGRDLLARYPDDRSKARQEVERSLESAEASLREGQQDWGELRARMLREAGVE